MSRLRGSFGATSPWESIRRVPALALTWSRVPTMLSIGSRISSSPAAAGTPLMIDIVVSLSRNMLDVGLFGADVLDLAVGEHAVAEPHQEVPRDLAPLGLRVLELRRVEPVGLVVEDELAALARLELRLDRGRLVGRLDLSHPEELSPVDLVHGEHGG